MIRVLEILGYTIFFYLCGSFIDADWEWFRHIPCAADRFAVLVAYFLGPALLATASFFVRSIK
jgi:hypothetical protein